MSDTSGGRITDDIGSALSRLVAQATGHVTLIATFITPGALERLVAEAEPSLPLSVFTRWRFDEMVAIRDCPPASGDQLLAPGDQRHRLARTPASRDWKVTRSLSGHWRAVEGVRDTGREEVVYNCLVAEYHTYFVGCDEWGFSLWAHNRCGPGVPDPTSAPPFR